MDKTDAMDCAARIESSRESALRIRQAEQKETLVGAAGSYKGAIRNWQRIKLGQIKRRLEKATSQEVVFFIFIFPALVFFSKYKALFRKE